MLYLKINTFVFFINASAPNRDMIRFKHYYINSAFVFGEITHDKENIKTNNNGFC